MKKKLILLGLPLAIVLAGCGGSQYSYNEYSEPVYSDSSSRQYYSNDYSRQYDTSARGNYPVNEHATVRTG